MDSPFFQQAPRLQNTYDADQLLRLYLEYRLPPNVLMQVERELANFGERVWQELEPLALHAEQNPPKLVSFSPWGERVDQLELSPSWVRLEKIAAEEGLVAIGYERPYGELSRLVQFAKLYLYHPSSAVASCPLAMTDGAARAIELHGGNDPYFKSAFSHLTSRDPDQFWTSGQWMTERTGGSDVSETATTAERSGSGYLLRGDKWFSSGTGSQMALALGRVIEANGVIAGSKGLSLFCVELRGRNNRLNNIRIERLKDKLGTKALPTAELRLEGTPARLLGSVGQGVKTVSSMLNITRIYNSICSIANTNRGLQLVRDYAMKRKVFGKTLGEQPLHQRTFADLTCEYEASFHLTFYLTMLLGASEVGKASDIDQNFLRILTPITKLYTAKFAVKHASEIIESFGGAGYIEDTGLPKLLRDAQVLSIWEGTTNVLSLDLLRALKNVEAFEVFHGELLTRLETLKDVHLHEAVALTRGKLDLLEKFVHGFYDKNEGQQQSAARDLAFAIGDVMCGVLLLEFAVWCEKKNTRPTAKIVAQRWAEKTFGPLHFLSEDNNKQILFS